MLLRWLKYSKLHYKKHFLVAVSDCLGDFFDISYAMSNQSNSTPCHREGLVVEFRTRKILPQGRGSIKGNICSCRATFGFTLSCLLRTRRNKGASGGKHKLKGAHLKCGWDIDSPMRSNDNSGGKVSWSRRSEVMLFMAFVMERIIQTT